MKISIGLKVYIIKQCEKLNASSANCLLKTLEEPEKNIYAFLITSNIDLVMATIKSRCQVIQCEKKYEKSGNEELINKTLFMINMLEKFGVKSIAYNTSDFYKSFEKNDLKEVLNMIILFYKDCLNKIYEINLL